EFCGSYRPRNRAAYGREVKGSMEALVSGCLVTLAVVLAIPASVLIVEVLAAITLSPRSSYEESSSGVRPRVAVLVPAHNESKGVLPTLSDLRRQLGAGDRLVVIADNCTDDTAAMAMTAGAEVLERHDPTRRGKGYALDYGLRHLVTDAPEIVIVVD